ncbi:hypothetical protein Fmac_023433 [Flemingia macrophylla]|uniref:Alpha/beta hydrolase fold-3 domain-containing protein n=1 Tax=Flemingia macrophylla TaxID=520843 RepID=A0ABD1LLJ3_9FABA
MSHSFDCETWRPFRHPNCDTCIHYFAYSRNAVGDTTDFAKIVATFNPVHLSLHLSKSSPRVPLVSQFDLRDQRLPQLGAILSHPYFCSSYPIGSESATGHEQSMPYVVWSFVYPSAPGGIDNPMVNPIATGAPSLAGLGCSKIIVCVAGNDKMRDRGVWYYEAVKESGWQGELELFEENGEDHVYHIFHPQSEKAIKLIKRLALFMHH